MSPGTRPDARDRARAARAFLRSRRTRFRPTAYQVYATLLLGAIAGVLGANAVSQAIGGSLTEHKLLVFGPAVLILVLLSALRFGTWQGPVGFSTADVSFLLTAPIAIAALVRPKLDHGLWIGAAAGAAIAGVAILLTAGGGGSFGLLRALGAVAAVTAFAVLAVAASWIVESSRRTSGLVRRASPAVLVAGAALLAVSATPLGRSIGVWSGPWGWAIAPLAGTSGWPAALALILLTATTATLLARRRAGAAGAEVFLVRAETRSGLTASAFSLDYRGAALTYRSALPARIARRARVPRPRHPQRAVLWRDALALVREPARLGWAALLAAAATTEALTHPGQAAPAAIAALLLYGAASLLCEPLRIDVDAPDTSALLLSWPFARVLVAHCLLPGLVLFGLTAVTIAAVVARRSRRRRCAGRRFRPCSPRSSARSSCASRSPRAEAGGSTTTCSCACSRSTRRTRSASPSSCSGSFPWLLAAVVVTGASAADPRPRRRGPWPAAPRRGLALGLATAATVVLAGVARGSRRPDQ